MRHILNNKKSYLHPNTYRNFKSLCAFCPSKYMFSTSLKTIIKSKVQALKEYDELSTLQFEKHLRSLILSSQNHQQKHIDKIVNKYKQISLTAAKPIHELLKQFLIHSKKYSQEDLVETIVYLSKIYQISFMDHEGKLDINSERLFQNPDFDHLIEQLKFGLSDNAYMSFENIVKVLEALTEMRYPDMEIIKLIMEKVEKYLDVNPKERSSFTHRLYQAEKKGYYTAKSNPINNSMAVEKALLENTIFQKNLTYFQEKKRNLLHDSNHQNVIEQFETEENYKNILQLLQNFDKFNKGAEHFIEAIISIRQQYSKLCEISQEYKVLRNPGLNYNLLELEENLLETGLITIEDVKNPQKIRNQKNEEEFEKIQKILKLMAEKLGFENFEDLLVENSKPSESKGFDSGKKISEVSKNRKQKEVYLFSKVVSGLAKYCSLANRLHGTEDKISLLNTKWQRFFTGRTFSEQTLRTQSTLDVEKIFLKSYAETLIFMTEHLPLMEFSVMSGSIRSKVFWFNGLLDLGYTQDVIEQLRTINITPETVENNPQNLNSYASNSLNTEQFLILIKILNHCAFTQFSQKKITIPQETHNKIIERLEQILDNSSASEQLSQNILTHNVLCDCINYIYQYNNSAKTSSQVEREQKLYDNLVDRLFEEVNRYEKDRSNHGLNTVYSSMNQLREAYRILQFQKFRNNDKNQVQIHEGLIESLFKMSEEKEEISNSNPYYQSIYQLLSSVYNKNTSSSEMNFNKLPYFLTGVTDVADSQDGVTYTGVYLASSDNSSLEGKYISGHINAFCQRIRQFMGVKVTPISINKFIDIQYCNYKSPNPSQSSNKNNQIPFGNIRGTRSLIQNQLQSEEQKEKQVDRNQKPAIIFNTNVFKPSLKLLSSEKIVDIVQKINQNQVRNRQGEEIYEDEDSSLANKGQEVTLNNFIKVLAVTVPTFDNLSHIKIHKILNSLKNISILHREETSSPTVMLSVKELYGRRAELLVGIDILKRQLRILLNEAELKEISLLFIQNYDSMIFKKQKILRQRNESKNIISFIEELQQTLEKKLPPKNERIRKMSITPQYVASQVENILLNGKRLTLDTFKQDGNQQNSTLERQKQLLDVPYLLDMRYVEYRDWKQLINKNTFYRQLNISDSNIAMINNQGQSVSNLTKILARRFLENSKQTIVAHPIGNITTPIYPADWRTTYIKGKNDLNMPGQNINRQELGQMMADLSTNAQQIINNRAETNIDDLNFLINLQNYKHEIKCLKTPDEICQYILSFNFIDQVLLPEYISNHNQKENQPSKTHFIKRDPKEYFNYLEVKHDKMYLDSPYIEYIFNKIQFTEQFKEKIEDRKTSKVRLYSLFQTGEINRKQYFDMVKKIDQKLIGEMKKGLKKKLLAHTNGINLLEEPRKIVQLEKNVSQLERIIKGARFYDQNLDEDLIQADGDYELALQIKRNKAERNLILYKIYYKSIIKGQKITDKEKRFLESWKNEYLQNLRSSHRQLHNSFTQSSLKKLPANDKQKIVLHNTNIIKKYSDLSLSDFVLQLNHFLDESVIGKMQTALYAKYLSETKSIPYDVVLQKTKNTKQFSAVSNKIEENIFNQKTKMTEKDIQQLISLTQVFKTEGVTSAYNYHQTYFKNIKQDLEKINRIKSHKLRTPLMKEFLKKKDFEFYSKYYPEDVKEIKERQVQKMFSMIFEKEGGSQHVSSYEIRKKVSEICSKMPAIRMNVPAYFGNFVLRILSHEKTDIFTKQKLIAYLEVFKVPLQIDSSDLLALIDDQQLLEEPGERQKLMDELRKISISSGNSNDKMRELLL